jgi:hypothetical protein
MTARMCDAPAKRLLEPQGISCLLCRQTSTDDRFMPRFYEPDLGAEPDSPVLDRLSDLVRHRSGSSGRSACELAMALNCRAIRAGVIPALKAARTAFTWPRIDLPLTVRPAGRLSMFWGWLSRNRGHVCGSHYAHGHKPSAPLSFRHCWSEATSRVPRPTDIESPWVNSLGRTGPREGRLDTPDALLAEGRLESKTDRAFGFD